MSDYNTVDYSIDNGICTIALNRPDVLNAMNRQLIDETALAFDEANRDPSASVIVFTGRGRAFCAGDDRDAHEHPEDENAARDLVHAIQRVTEVMVFGDKPVVGAINGWAVGGGFSWAVNCDFPIWARGARGFLPEVFLNLFVTGGITALLPAMAGLNRAREMLMLGERYDADALLEMGVAWRVVDDERLMAEALETAEKVARLPALSARAMKRVLGQTAAADLKKAMELETGATVEGFMDPETTRRLKDF
ncbi:MAG: enoyl-CoA hydratase/isomerase family protein [Gammaproteobacteria bacterium]|nr:enoyl-CoA hydratase/isomerase family protein [Gammaproteobacteria bacterium]